ncbi:MAG: DUF2919 domain-containing protein [Colwellia sp.]|nr:DUF2919 domain-containing protein [Colwellia sp.]
MVKHNYSDYSVQDFDNFDCLKVSKWVYLSLVFILRGYVVWLMSVTNMKDRVGIIQWIYPETSLFYLSLGSGAFGVFIVLVLSLRRPKANNWIKRSWSNMKGIIILALFFDLIISVCGFFYWHLLSLTWLITQAIIVVGLIIMLNVSKRFRINIAEFPEPLPEVKRKKRFLNNNE